MVDTDNWETQEGYICQGSVIGFVELGTVIVAGDILTWGTPAQNKIVMNGAIAGGNEASGVAVAMKGGVSGDKIPAVFFGVCKMVAYSTCTVGGAVISPATAGTTITYGNVCPLTAANTEAGMDLAGVNGSGTAFILGMALQAGTTIGDELLVLIGGFGR